MLLLLPPVVITVNPVSTLSTMNVHTHIAFSMELHPPRYILWVSSSLFW
uniref:Uncharacterized protein n=1 Tax=Arundo donax TaxID=35708 RepID=A0A0A8ZSY6_ARUDO